MGFRGVLPGNPNRKYLLKLDIFKNNNKNI